MRITNLCFTEIIKTADIETITVKGIRKRIEAEDERDYSEEKPFFAETIQTLLEEHVASTSHGPKEEENDTTDDYQLALELQEAEEEAIGRKSLRRRQASTLKKYAETIHITKKDSSKTEGNGEGTKKRKGNSTFNKPMLMSDELQALFDHQYTQISRPETVKRIWEYIRAHNLQDPSDKRMIICDDKLFSVFKKKRVSCFGMNKILSAHLYRADSVVSSQVNSDAEDSDDDSSKKTSPSKKAKTSDKKPALSRETVLSDEEYGEAEERRDLALLHPNDPLRKNLKQTEKAAKKHKIHPLLLAVPGITEDMSFSMVQASVLNYTKAAHLRDPQDPDMILLIPDNPIYDVMGATASESVHLLELIKRVDLLYHQEH